ncbi:helicase [Methanocalculus chunghsingensis]|uniref:Helicase n=1 Tax=Methanocalculus chunghsingensis TaxID=156457 RepID=A0A8J7WB33_9EURY|nr:DUF3427 domain-containing protein [Methanocalculus chunghsingensis]MBR1369665.1 helicase [Methanocalculus chunghsingensis]
MDPAPGIYEQLIYEHLSSKLNQLDREGNSIQREKIKKFDSQAILSQYLHKTILRTLRIADEEHIPLDRQVAFCNEIIRLLSSQLNYTDLELCTITSDAELLLAVQQGGRTGDRVLTRPRTSIAQSSLFTGSPNEPSLANEFKQEIRSSDRIDLLISFIKWSGIRLIIDDLRDFVQRGNTLRIITTSYMGATDLKAIEELAKLPNTEIRISYDTDRTRLHAKTYAFHRKTGFSTAYIGSANISNPAMTSGLEWNVKVTEQDSVDIIRKIETTFESYWHSPEFVLYRHEKRDRLRHALSKETSKEPTLYPVFDIRPYYFQKEILERLQAERQLHGNYRNLIVAATGTGKTVISAFDYKNQIPDDRQYPRLLFVAHREEILRQSLQVFRGILRDPNFGDLMVGGNRPSEIDHLFVSIQSFNSTNLPEMTTPDYYDMIIVDEFHHAAAPSYQGLLSYYTPQILVGLTATPERMDGLEILRYFGGKITAEIRLAEAINRKLLAPFHYFGVTDVVDLDGVSWKQGRYDARELSKLYTASSQRVDHIIQSIERYMTDIRDIIGLGFCVSIEHAEYMAASFQKAGIPAAALHSQSSREERHSVQKRLVTGEITFIFIVDLYNEGVDIPEVNTILFLRPTESLTVFLQQLGRGLRLMEGKECLTVLDFVGRHNTRYRFGEKLLALLSPGGMNLQAQVQSSAYQLPKGCHLHLEKVAQERILENIKANLLNKRYLIDRIKGFEMETGKPLSFRRFLEEHTLTPDDIYAKGTFTRLASEAGVYPEKYLNETLFSKVAARRLSTIDSPLVIDCIRSFLQDPVAFTDRPLTPIDEKIIALFYYSLYDRQITDPTLSLQEIFSDILDHREIADEIDDLLGYTYDHIEFLPEPIAKEFESPLELHCTYTRDQAFAALGHHTLTERAAAGMREGVVYLRDQKIDIFFITLQKTEELYSPTTMYNDYAVTDTLFHWQSQNATSETSPVGRRYIEHEEHGTNVLFFVREFSKNGGITQPFIFLGTARYISHEGSRPMSILWELDRPMPPGLFQKANKVMVE